MAAMQIVGNEMLKFTGEHLVTTRTVRELIFDGYDDPVLDLLHRLKLKQFVIPFERFGWFVERNLSSSYDGRFHMNTGAADIRQLGMLQLWNGQNRTPAFGGDCGRIYGTSAELWPPADKFAPLTMFLGDVCRSITLKWRGEQLTKGIVGQKYVGDESVFDNGWNYPEMGCYCTSDVCPDLLPGAVNVSECKFGAPAFISYPHFHLADPSYRTDIDGLRPDAKEHEFYMVIERSTGIPLEVRAPIQINLMMDEYPHMK